MSRRTASGWPARRRRSSAARSCWPVTWTASPCPRDAPRQRFRRRRGGRPGPYGTNLAVTGDGGGESKILDMMSAFLYLDLVSYEEKGTWVYLVTSAGAYAIYLGFLLWAVSGAVLNLPPSPRGLQAPA